LCANLADPAPAGAARGRGPAATGTTSLSAEHLADLVPTGAARGCGPIATSATGLSVGHGPLLATRSRDPTAGLSTGHGPLRAARGRGLAAATGLWWTRGPDSSAGGQR